MLTIQWDTHGRPMSQLARFGFRMRDGVRPMTSFRCESIKLAVPQRAFLEGRCIVPADAFVEIVPGPDGPRSTMYAAKDGRVMALAGMLRPDTIGASVTVLTVPAAANVRSINRRMPAILFREDFAVWMDDTTSAADALALTRFNHDDLLVEQPC